MWRPLQLFVLFGLAASAAAQPFAYPEAEQVDAVDVLHGEHIPDPYRWMENLDAPALQAWMQAQDALLDRYLASSAARAPLVDRIHALRDFDVFGLPSKAGGRYFYTVTGEGGNGATHVFVRPELDAPGRLVFDVEQQLAEGATFRLFTPSPSGADGVVLYSEGPSRWRQARILRVEQGELLDETLDGLHALGGPVAWAPDGQGFYYVRFAATPGETRQQSRPQEPRLYYHQLGTSQAADRLIYEPADLERALLTHQVTDDGRYLVVSIRHDANPDQRIVYLDLQAGGAPRPFIHGPHTFLGNDEGRFYFYTTEDAPNGRVIAVTLDNPGQLEELVAERDEAISGNSLVGGNGVGYYGGRFVLLYTKDALPLVRVFDASGALAYEVELPDVGTIWGGFKGHDDSDEVFYRFLSLTDANVLYRLDLATGESRPFQQPSLAFDSDRFETQQVFYTSKDGTRVPMFVVHRKGLELDGSNPLFMYAYGAFGWTAFLWYQPHVIAWLEMGGVYALPGIRGGGEYGRSWHEDGVGQNRQNAVDDYIAATEWLIDQGYTSPDRMVANGGSASASLAAMAVLQRPDLYGAAVIDIPSLDLLRYHRHPGSGGWVEEFGDPDDPDDFSVLRRLSPYHTIEAGACYPPMLVMAGEKDETALPLHAYKFVARMQANAPPGCASPALLKVMWGAGHSYGTTARQQAQSWADAWAFLDTALGLRLRPDG